MCLVDGEDRSFGMVREGSEMSDYGKRLKTLREWRGLTQKQLANILGIETRSISRYEEMDALPRVDTAVKIAHYFGTSVEEMVEGEKK